MIVGASSPCASAQAAPDNFDWGTGAATAWAAGYTGTGVRIAIIDDGVETRHNWFRGLPAYGLCTSATEENPNYLGLCPEPLDPADPRAATLVVMNMGGKRVVGRPGFQTGPTAGRPPTWLPAGVLEALQLWHGTFVGGLATGASSRTFGFPNSYRGIAPDASLTAANVTIVAPANGRLLAAITPANLADALEMISEQEAGVPRADVVNISLANPRVAYSGATCDNEARAHPNATIRTIAEIVDELDDDGTVVVAAAGNDFADHVRYPACLSKVVSVGGLGADMKPYPEYLPAEGRIDVAARAVNVRAPNVGGSTRVDSGTSFAAPQVSGAIALYRQKHPDKTPAQIRSRLRRVLPRVNNNGASLSVLSVPELLGLPRGGRPQTRNPDCVELHLLTPSNAPNSRRGVARLTCSPTKDPIDRFVVLVDGPDVSLEHETRTIPAQNPAYFGAHPTFLGPKQFRPTSGGDYRVCYLLYTAADRIWPHMTACENFEA